MKKILIALPALIAATAHTGTTNAHYLRVVERPDPHTIRFVGSDLIEVSKLLQFINNYEPGLEP